jgi:hypothetical protein
MLLCTTRLADPPSQTAAARAGETPMFRCDGPSEVPSGRAFATAFPFACYRIRPGPVMTCNSRTCREGHGWELQVASTEDVLHDDTLPVLVLRPLPEPPAHTAPAYVT